MLRTAGFGFTQTMKVFEGGGTNANGRVAYTLQPEQGSIYSQVSGSATGSNSMLEEARYTILQQNGRIQQLEGQLAARG